MMKLLQRIEEKLATLDCGVRVFTGELRRYWPVLEERIAQLERPLVSITYNEYYPSEMAKRVSKRISKDEVLTFIDQWVKRFGCNESFAELPLDLVVRHKGGKTHITLSKRKQPWRHDFALVVYISELPKLSELIARFSVSFR